MAILLDTNVLLRLVQKRHPHSPIANRATNLLDVRNDAMVIAHQSMVEFWAVATRPASANGLDLTVEDVEFEIAGFKKLFRVLPELPIHEEWLRLVTKYRVMGKNVHDARLVAAMVVHGVKEILTFNGPDFARYAEISVLDPFQIL